MNARSMSGPEGSLVRISLRLMATTDLHMHLLPGDETAHEKQATVGLAWTASLIRRSRGEVDNALLFDNGDFLHGNAAGDMLMGDVLKGRREARGRHPIVNAMRVLKFDAINLGNHDFDHGAEFLGQVLMGAPCPVLASNLTLRSRNNTDGGPRPAPATQPFALIERELVDTVGGRHQLKIGLLGLLPPGTITGLQNGPFQAETRDIVDTAAAMVPQLRGLGADMVIVLAHSGFGPAARITGMENALLPLAEVPGIDAIVGGHTHVTFPDAHRVWPEGVDGRTGHVNGVPTVIPGFWGSHLGEIDLQLARTKNGQWRVIASEARARRVVLPGTQTVKHEAALQPDRAILTMLKTVRASVSRKSREKRGETRLRLHNYFAAVAPSTALDVVHRAKLWWARRALAGTAFEGLPVIAAAAPFKAGGFAGPGYYVDIAPGPITARDVVDLYLYPNDICALRMTASELGDWIERSVSVFGQITPGRDDQPLLAPGTPLYNYESLAGCEYEIDLSAPARYSPDGQMRDDAATRVREIRTEGQMLAPDAELLLLTSTYRANGGGNYPAADPAQVALAPGKLVRDIVSDYLAISGPLHAPPQARWRFAPVPGASVTFPSAPIAAETLDPRFSRIEPGQIAEDGFRRYRLALDQSVSYIDGREVGAGRRLANPVRSGRKQP